MQTDQTTLAALLHEIHGGGPCFARYRNCDLYAARLIAAGVTCSAESDQQVSNPSDPAAPLREALEAAIADISEEWAESAGWLAGRIMDGLNDLPDPAAPLVLDGPCDDQCRHPLSDPAAPLREALVVIDSINGCHGCLNNGSDEDRATVERLRATVEDVTDAAMEAVIAREYATPAPKEADRE